MSLKAFHIVFIVASIALALGFGGWCIKEYFNTGNRSDLIWGIASLLVGVLLVIYSRYFLKKLRDIGFL